MTHISESIFHDTHSSGPGSAVSCISSSIDADVSNCIFLNCSSLFAGTSSSRPTEFSSGGACYLDVNNINVSNCYFYKCSGAGLGAALYACGPKDNQCIASCLSSYLCFNQKSTFHSIYAIELITQNISNMNSTHDTQDSTYSVYHIGRYPVFYYVSFFTVNFSPIHETETKQSAIALSLSESSLTGYLSHVFISNAISQSGIISIFQGHHIITDATLYQCSGKIICLQQTDSSITFIDSNFDPLLPTDETILSLTNCKTSPSYTQFLYNCSFPNIPLLTCFIKTKIISHQHLFIILSTS